MHFGKSNSVTGLAITRVVSAFSIGSRPKSLRFGKVLKALTPKNTPSDLTDFSTLKTENCQTIGRVLSSLEIILNVKKGSYLELFGTSDYS